MAALLSILWTIFGWRKYHLLFCLALNLFNSTLNLYTIHLNSMLTDKMFQGQVKKTEDWFPLFLEITLVAVFQSMTALLRQYIEGYIDAFYQVNIQAYTLQRFMHKDMSFYAHPMTQPDHINARVASANSVFHQLVHQLPFQLIEKLFTFALHTWYILQINHPSYRMIVAALLAQPFIGMLIAHQTSFIRSIQPEIDALTNNMQARSRDIVGNVEFCKLVMAQDEVLAMRLREHYVAYDLLCHVVRQTTTYGIFTPYFGTLTKSAVFIMGCNNVVDGTMPWGSFAAFNGTISNVSNSISSLFALYQAFGKIHIVATTLSNMMNATVRIERQATAKPFDTERPMFNELPGTAGTEVQHILRNVVARRKQVTVPTEVRMQRLRFEMTSRPNTPLPGIWRLPSPWSIELRDVSFYHPVWLPHPQNQNIYPTVLQQDPTQRNMVLHHLTARIGAGEIVHLYGENGSGKSTLLSLLFGLHNPVVDENNATGQVLINGINLAGGGNPGFGVDIESIRYGIGFLQQRVTTVSGTLLSNIFLGLGGTVNVPEYIRSERRQLTIDFLRRTQFPMSEALLDTEVKQMQKGASGGEVQKISLLRVMMFKYSIIILDEPLTGMDTAGRQFLCRWLKDIKNNRGKPHAYSPTIVFVEHTDLKNALPDDFFDQVVRLPKRTADLTDKDAFDMLSAVIAKRRANFTHAEAERMNKLLQSLPRLTADEAKALRAAPGQKSPREALQLYVAAQPTGT